VSSLVENCPDIIDLDLSDATLLTGLTIDFIINGLPKLQHLHLSRCYNIPSISYLSLSNISSLQQFVCFGILTETALQTLRGNLPNIEINRHLFSFIARPTTGIRRTSIWHLRVRD
ncbi:S-phase kinase-associated protein 2-like, partial [Centruroides sculpturatus]